MKNFVKTLHLNAHFFSICGVSTWLCVDQLKVQLLGICRTPAVVHSMYAAVRPTHDDHTRAR